MKTRTSVLLAPLVMVLALPAFEAPLEAQEEALVFEYSWEGQELPQYTIVETFYRRVIQVARTGSYRPASWVTFLDQVGFERESDDEAALLRAAWKAEDLFKQRLTPDAALDADGAEEYQLGRIREQARQLARIHKDLLNVLNSGGSGDAARLLEQYCETKVRPSVRTMGTDLGEYSRYVEAVEEFDREMQHGER